VWFFSVYNINSPFFATAYCEPAAFVHSAHWCIDTIRLFCLKQPRPILRIDNCMFQLVSCVWIDEVKEYSGCYVLQLLSLYCLRQAGYTYRPLTLAERDCISPDDTGLSMDCACFVFLLIQYRIFTSDYFRFVKRELREQSEVASW
jgi:hypothetical protein